MYEIAGFGNPLLDIIVHINDDVLLEKYTIQPDEQKEISDDEMKSLFDDIEKYKKQFNAGGCAQNTLRIFQWIIGKPNSTVFFGRIGNDEQGKELQTIVNKDNVATKYQIDHEHITGTCIGLVSNEYRALLANISAAQYYNKETLENDMESLKILRNTKIIYVEGCFLTERTEIARYIAEFCMKNKRLLAFNLSCLHLVEMEPEMIKNYVEKSNILFGNQEEFKALGNAMNISDIEDVARELNKTYTNHNNNELNRFGKIVVITNGAKDIKCVYGDNVLKCFSVRRAENVVDTVSAGDGFVAGFLVAFLKGFDIETCIEWGQLSAIEIIKQPGCTIPNYSASNVFKIHT